MPPLREPPRGRPAQRPRPRELSVWARGDCIRGLWGSRRHGSRSCERRLGDAVRTRRPVEGGRGRSDYLSLRSGRCTSGSGRRGAWPATRDRLGPRGGKGRSGGRSRSRGGSCRRGRDELRCRSQDGRRRGRRTCRHYSSLTALAGGLSLGGCCGCGRAAHDESRPRDLPGRLRRRDRHRGCPGRARNRRASRSPGGCGCRGTRRGHGRGGRCLANGSDPVIGGGRRGDCRGCRGSARGAIRLGGRLRRSRNHGRLDGHRIAAGRRGHGS